MKLTFKGQDYEVDADGTCYVIKTRHSWPGAGPTIYRSRITSARKIAALRKIAGRD